MGYISGGRYITTYSHATRIEQEVRDEMVVLFEQRFGQNWSEFRFNQLSSAEQEWVVHNAGINVQKRRKGKKEKA